MDGSARPPAVVTGASSGIGFELAKIFGEEGYDLIVAAQGDEFAAAADRLRTTGAEVEAHTVDLATETDLADELEIIDLNVRSTVHLCKLVLPDMVERDEGRILFTSSVAATIPDAFQAVYNASKSFVQSFAPALRNELKDTEVSVTALMPGPTDTEFFEVADMEVDGKNTAVGTEEKDDPARVARQGYDALVAGKERVVGGSLKNKVQVAAGEVVPDSLKAEMHRKMAEPGTGEGEDR